MYPNGSASPLEHLAAFAIVLVTAVIGTVAVGKYVDRVRREAHGCAAGPTWERDETERNGIPD